MLEVKEKKKKFKNIWMSSTSGNLLGVCRKQYKNKNRMLLAVLFVNDSLTTSHFQRHNRLLVNIISFYYYYLFIRVILLTYTQKKVKELGARNTCVLSDIYIHECCICY
jgi:hypothetical protein